MSHFTDIEIEIRDIAALEEACREMGFTLEHHAEARGYGSQKRKADHVIRLPGPYDIAVLRAGDGAYTLSADLWAGHVEKHAGANLGRLKQMYGIHAATRQAQQRGLRVRRRQLENGTVRLVLTGV